MKHKAKDVESYESKNRGYWVLRNIKQRTMSHMKYKAEDIESHETKNGGRWVL